MWGKLNSPMFLFNVGLLTLMNMALVFIAKLTACVRTALSPWETVLTAWELLV